MEEELCGKTLLYLPRLEMANDSLNGGLRRPVMREKKLELVENPEHPESTCNPREFYS